MGRHSRRDGPMMRSDVMSTDNGTDSTPTLVHVYRNALPESTQRAFLSACVTLTLGILGSSVLPVPYAFSRTGILPGLAISFTIALSNAYTGTLILRAAGHLGKRTYEGVCAGAIGSAAARVAAQLALIALLFGTLAGDAALLADTGTLTIEDFTEGTAPKWLTGSGRIPMLVLITFLVIPLSLSRRMRSLERAAIAGVFLVLILAVVVVHGSIAAGLPAIVSGELPFAKPAPGAKAQLPEAVAVLSFAFYLQPMLLPLLSEMPPGRAGLDATCRALQIVTVGFAFVVYAILGIFAAARWGLKTEGDVLVNTWLPGRSAGYLDASMAVYLSISMAPMAITMRYLLDAVVASGELATFVWRRDLIFTLGSIIAATAVASAWPEKAETLFAVTGASAVCLVAYVFPVAVHLSLYMSSSRISLPSSSEQEVWLLQDAALLEECNVAARRGSSVVDQETAESAAEQIEAVDILTGAYPHISKLSRLPWWRKAVTLVRQVCIPLLVGCLGIAASASALWLSAT